MKWHDFLKSMIAVEAQTFPTAIFLSSTISTTSLNKQRQHLNNLIQKLSGLIKKLLTTLPCGSKDGPLAKHFSDHTYDATEGPYFTFNKGWKQAFQCTDSQGENLVVIGKYGLDLVQAYIVHFAKMPEINANNGLSLLAQRVEVLIALIEVMYFFNYVNNSPCN
jgi:hypothetical protein